MGVAARREPGMNVAEFQAWVEETPEDERWELLDGVPVLMSPPKARHQRVIANLVRRLDELAERRGCNALPGLGVLSAAMDDFAPIPDIVVLCGALPPDGYTRDPLLVAEVLSPSTMTIDRGRKIDFYKTVASLRRFFIVYPDEARIEMFLRSDAEVWESAVLGLDDAIDLPELGGAVAVRDVYRNVVF